MSRYWYCHLPRHVAGSGGNGYIGKTEATEDEIRKAFSHCAWIDALAGTVNFFKRP